MYYCASKKIIQMKKTIQILFFSALSVAGFAQHKAAITQFEGPKALKKLTAEDPIKRAPQIQVTQNGNREIVFHIPRNFRKRFYRFNHFWCLDLLSQPYRCS